MKADTAWVLVQLCQRFGVPLTVVPGKLAWLSVPFYVRCIGKQHGLARYLVPFVEVGHRIAEILK